MKWWKLLLWVTVLGAVAFLQAGKADIIRFRRMRQM
jgi:hypothetical protein